MLELETFPNRQYLLHRRNVIRPINANYQSEPDGLAVRQDVLDCCHDKPKSVVRPIWVYVFKTVVHNCYGLEAVLFIVTSTLAFVL